MKDAILPMSHFAISSHGKNDHLDHEIPTAICLDDEAGMDISMGEESTTHMASTDFFPLTDELMDYLWHTTKPPVMSPLPGSAITDMQPTSSRDDRKPAAAKQSRRYFIDGKELARNVGVGLTRSFVYSLDMGKRELPEFLFLDVPSSKFAAVLCAKCITNQLSQSLQEDVDQKPNSKRNIIQSCNLQIYQQAVTMPFGKGGKRKTVVVRFRMRFVQPHRQIHDMLRWNFFGGRSLEHGIVVLIPSFPTKSAFEKLWGKMEAIDSIPDSDVAISKESMDSFIKKCAKHHGLYGGRLPNIKIAAKQVDTKKKGVAAKKPGMSMKTEKSCKLVACKVGGKNMFPSKFKIYTYET
jgi:hypothetical protein